MIPRNLLTQRGGSESHPARLEELEPRVLLSLESGISSADLVIDLQDPSQILPSLVTVSVDDVAITEGNTGTKAAVFPVRISVGYMQPWSGTVEYWCRTRDGTAIAGSDYVPVDQHGLLSFAPFQAMYVMSVPVSVIGDSVCEEDETFFLDVLVRDADVIIMDYASDTGQGLILNDDPPSAPVNVRLDPFADTGASNHDGITKEDGDPVFIWDGSPSPGVVGYQVLLSFYPTPWLVAGTSFVWPIDQLVPEGRHSISVWAKDSAGRLSEPASYEFTIDSTPPPAPILLSPPDGAVIPEASPTLDWSDVPGVWRYHAYADSYCYCVDHRLEAEATGSSWIVPSDWTERHPHFWWGATAVDIAGNESAPSAEWELTVHQEAWIPYVPTDAQTTIIISDSVTGYKANVSIDFPTAGFRVSDWGAVVRNGNAFTADAKVEEYTGPSAQVITTLGHSYDLGSLPPGSYTFTFKSWGTTVETNPFEVPLLQPSLSINGVAVTEGDSGTRLAVFTLSLSQPTSRTVTVNWATANGTAVAPGDYTAASGRLTFNPGETSKPVTVQVKGDILDEPDQEAFYLNLSGASNATIADGQGIGTILDDDPVPFLSISDVREMEGNIGGKYFFFTVDLSSPSGQLVTVRYRTPDPWFPWMDRARPGEDYLPMEETLWFWPGDTNQTARVWVLGDNKIEWDEFFEVQLFDAVNATILNEVGRGFIENDDWAALQFSSAAFNVNENAGIATITVTKTGNAGGVGVRYATSNGTATAGSDYSATSDTLTFASNETSKTFTVPIINDSLVEGNETVNLTLSNPIGGAILGGPSSAVLTILDDETAPIILSGAREDTDFPISYDDLVAAADKAGYDDSLIDSFRIESVGSGTLTKNGSSVVPGTTLFSGGESLLWCGPKDANGTLDGFSVVIRDVQGALSSPVQVKLQVAPVNDQPVANARAVSLEEDGAIGILLSAYDVETAEDELVFQIIEEPHHGHFGPIPILPDWWRHLTYIPDSNYNGPDSFCFTVTDNGDPAGSHANPGDLTSDPATVSITVSPVNDAPVLDNSGNPTLTAIPMNTVNPPGNSVGEIVIDGSISDVDVVGAAPESIAVTGADNADGAWEYSTDAGSSWTVFGSVTDTVALLLRETDKVRFVPQAGWSGTPTITYRAWDQTSGTAGGTADTSANGGTTAFSTATETGSIIVRREVQFAQSLTLEDADGDLVTVTLKGGGMGTAYFAHDGRCDLDRIDLTGTSEKSSLSIAVKGSGVLTNIGEITGNTPLGKLSAKAANLVGEGINMAGQGYIGSVQLHDIENGADITMDGITPKGITIDCAWVHDDTDISLSSYLNSMTATQWDSGSLATDLWVENIKIKGEKKTGTVGDFGAGLDLNGRNDKGLSLGKFTAAGSITSGEWKLAYGAGTITAASFDSNWEAHFGTFAGWWDVVSITSTKGDLSGTVSARSIGSISAKANVAAATINLSRKLDAKLPALGKLSAGGWIDGTSIVSAGTIGSVTSGGMRNSAIFAGVLAYADDNKDGVWDLPGSGFFAPFDPTAGIKRLTIKRAKIGKIYADSFINSNIAAGDVGSLDIWHPDLNNGGWPFGVAGMKIGRIRLDGVTVRPPVKIGDFEIRLL